VIEQRPTDTLIPHPINAAIYGDGPDAELVDSIETQGILTPLIITETGIILSGHRRWAAAKKLSLPTVPVIISPLTDDLDVREAVIESNRQRDKTTEQRGREYTEIKAIETERARRRMATSGPGVYGGKPGVENLPQAVLGKSRDIAAGKVGMSGKTAEKAATVVKAVDTLREQGKLKEAEELRRALNSKPVSSSYRKASTMGLVPKPEHNGHDAGQRGLAQQASIVPPGVTVHCGDARRLGEYVSEPVDLVVTSPPYNAGIEYDTHDDRMPDDEYFALLTDVWRQCFVVMASGARLCVVTVAAVGRNPYNWHSGRNVAAIEAAGFTYYQEIVWNKGKPVIAGLTSWGSFCTPEKPYCRDRSERIHIAYKVHPALSMPDSARVWDEALQRNISALLPKELFIALSDDVWDVPPESAKSVGHPAPFPVKLAEHLIRFYGYRGCHVLDPFAGSGTTGVAALRLGAKATLIDLDASYCDIARRRCAIGV